jgi:ketosteroid isomerase-like protein
METRRAETSEEARVRELVVGWTRAIASGDRKGILAHHSADLLMFDFTETVRGIEPYDRTWDFFYAAPKGPIRFDARDVEVTVGADVAFVTCQIRCEGTSGGVVELRLTVGLRKIGGEWTITHEHHSVPSIEERFQPPPGA